MLFSTYMKIIFLTFFTNIIGICLCQLSDKAIAILSSDSFLEHVLFTLHCLR